MASLERRFSLFEVGASGSAPAAVSGSGRKRARVEIAAEREAMIEAACIEYKCGVQKLRGLYVLGKAKVSGLSAATKRLEPENRCKRCNEKMHDCIVLTENGDEADMFPKGTNSCGFCLQFGKKCDWEEEQSS